MSPASGHLSQSGSLDIILIALGSAGDVHPFAGLGHSLRERGHRVEVFTNPYFEKLIRSLDLDFVPVGTAQQFLEATEDPRLWHPIEGFKFVARWLMLEGMRPIYDLIIQRFEPGTNRAPGRKIVVGPFSAFGARLAQEKFGVPLVSVHLQPGLMRSVYDAPEFRCLAS
jgi:rhamnosyltransferase subunit B